MDPDWGDSLADPADIDMNAGAPAAEPVALSSGSRGGSRQPRRPSHAAASRGGRGLGDAMHEAFEVNNARDVKRSQATDVAAMELRLVQQMQEQHAELMRAQQEPARRAGRGAVKNSHKLMFPSCDLERAKSVMDRVKSKGCRADDGGNVMFNFRHSMVYSEHSRKEFTGYVWSDDMIQKACRFVMTQISRVYPQDMLKIGYNSLTPEDQQKFLNCIISPGVMTWRRIHLSEHRTAARKFFYEVEGLQKDVMVDNDFVSDIEHRASEQVNKKQSKIVSSYFQPIEGWFNKPTFVIWLAKILQHLQSYSNYGMRDLSINDIAFHVDAVVQSNVAVQHSNRQEFSVCSHEMGVTFSCFQIEPEQPSLTRRPHGETPLHLGCLRHLALPP